jgi:transcriptional regulator with XRE-family HTH domain
MESNSGAEMVGFVFLRCRLLEIVANRINNGEFTERGLARLIGVSQPQIHNVLKGARNLSHETADLLLEKLGISIADLLVPVEHNTVPLPPDPSQLLALAQAAGFNSPSPATLLKKPPASELHRGGQSYRTTGS